jgi:hypothetical protein
MTSGLFALAGVVIGGLLTAVVTFWFERRREARELRTAARVIDKAYNLLGLAADTTIEDDTWSPFDEALPQDEFAALWREHRNTLAGHLSSEAWQTVASAEVRVSLIHTIDRDNSPSHELVSQSLRLLIDGLEGGHNALVPYTE